MDVELGDVVKHRYTKSLWSVTRFTKNSVVLTKFAPKERMINPLYQCFINKKKFSKRYVIDVTAKVLYGR